MNKKFVLIAALFALVCTSAFAELLYTGTGGKGKSLAIVIPESKGLQAGEDYLPALVQGILVDVFTKYSKISVIDRQHTNALFKETESGIYKEDADIARLGSIAQAQYVLVGSITKTSSYLLQLRVMNTKTGMPEASYSETANREALEDLSAEKAAAAALLEQMGVQLTAAAKTALIKPVEKKEQTAQTSLAKGIAAQESGNSAAAMNYFYEASGADPNLKEAVKLANSIGKNIASGNIGEEIRDDLARKKAWRKILEDASAYYKTNPFFDFAYYPVPEKRNINERNNTARIVYEMWAVPNARFEALKQIINGFLAAQAAASSNWGDINISKSLIPDNGPKIIVNLIDSTGFVISSAECRTLMEIRSNGALRFSFQGTGTNGLVGFNVNINDIPGKDNEMSISPAASFAQYRVFPTDKKSWEEFFSDKKYRREGVSILDKTYVFFPTK